MIERVLDASVPIAIMRGEAGANRALEATGPGSLISTVNVVEVYTRILDLGVSFEVTHSLFTDLGVATAAFDVQLARLASALRPATRHLGLSLGDRACLALAMREGATAVTADRRWAELGLDVAVEVIR